MLQFSNICCLIFVMMLVRIELNRRKGKIIENNLNFLDSHNMLLWFLILFGFVVIRFIGLGEIPGGINQDEAMSAVDALALSKYGTDRFGTFMPAHFTAWGYGQMSVLLAYLTVPFIKLFGFNTIIIRLPMLVLSVAGAIAVYCLSKTAFGEKAAIIIFLFTAINPWHFMQSRWAIDCNVFPHMFVIGLCFLSMIWENQKYLYYSMFFFALCMYSYGVAFYMVPLFLLASSICLLRNKIVSIKQCLISALLYFGVSFPIYGTMLINLMKWETVELPFVTMTYFENNVRVNDILFFCDKPLEQLAINAKALVRTVFLQKPDLIWNAIDDFGTMYKCSIPFIIMGIIIVLHTARNKTDMKERILCRLIIIYWICSLITGLCINSVNVNRINIIFYSHIIFAGVGIYYVIKRWKIMAIIIISVFAIQSTLFLNRYFTTWSDEMDTYFYDDFIEAVEFAGNQECDYYYITPDTQYEGSANVSEILTMFAQQIDAEYYQGKTNQYRGALISYADRYRFRNPEQGEINAQQKTAYVIKTESLSNYDLNLFSVKRFDNYCVVMPTQYAGW